MVSVVNSKSNYSTVPNLGLELQAAIDQNRPQEALKMMKSGDLGNQPLPNRQLPLHYAIRHGKQELVEGMLKEIKYDPTRKDVQGMTALDHAIITADPKMISLIAGHTIGTAFDAASQKSFDLFEMAEMKTFVAQMDKIRSGSLFTELPPLHKAAREGNLTEVKALLNPKDPHVYDKYGMTPLQHAALAGKKEVVEWLLGKGGAAIVTSNGATLLHLAAAGGHTHLVSYLVKTHKLDVNAGDLQKATPLFYAMSLEDLSVAKTLIALGANPVSASVPFTPLDLFFGIAKERSKKRDPLELQDAHYLAFGFIAASWMAHLCGTELGGHDTLLQNWGSFLTALSYYESTGAMIAHALGFFASTQLKDAHFMRAGGLKFNIHLPQYKWASHVNLAGDMTPKWLLGVDTGYQTATGIQAARGAFKGIAAAWKNRSFETIRPLRNALIHTVIGAGTVKIATDTIQSNLDAFNVHDAWATMTATRNQYQNTYNTGVKLNSLLMFGESCVKRKLDWMCMDESALNALRAKVGLVDPMCQGKTERECILEGEKQFASMGTVQCPAEVAQDCTFEMSDGIVALKGQIPRSYVQSKVAAMLGLNSGYTDADRKSAFRNMGRKYHPDSEKDPALKKEKEKLMQIITSANTLCAAPQETRDEDDSADPTSKP